MLSSAHEHCMATICLLLFPFLSLSRPTYTSSFLPPFPLKILSYSGSSLQLARLLFPSSLISCTPSSLLSFPPPLIYPPLFSAADTSPVIFSLYTFTSFLLLSLLPPLLNYLPLSLLRLPCFLFFYLFPPFIHIRTHSTVPPPFLYI